jgi:SAM-dependent methyltransferase
MLELMASMRGVLFSLLDPLVAGRPVGTVLEAGVSAVCQPGDLAHRYDWELRSLGPGYALDSLPFQNASFDAILALDGLPAEPAMREMVRVLAYGGMLVLGGRADGYKSLINMAENQSIRVLRSSCICPVDNPFPAALQALWLRAGLNLPLGKSVILIGEKTG